MNSKYLWRGAAIGAVAVAALAGCGNSGSTVPTPPPPTSSTTAFSFFVEQVYGAGADTTPVPINNLVFDFDVNDDPNAFNYAFM